MMYMFAYICFMCDRGIHILQLVLQNKKINQGLLSVLWTLYNAAVNVRFVECNSFAQLNVLVLNCIWITIGNINKMCILLYKLCLWK